MDLISPPRVPVLSLRHPASWLLVMLGMGMILSGCSDSEKVAERALEDKRYAFTVEDYLLAAGAGDAEAVRLFREAGQAVDATDPGGNTALMRAAAGGHSALVGELLSAGADPRAANREGRTPLMFAAESGRIEPVRALLSRGAEVKAKDRGGKTALDWAVDRGRAEAVEWLAGRVDQAALDAVLSAACRKGDPAVIEPLLKHGAYVNTRNDENQTPLMIAARFGHAEAVGLLLRHQANPFAVDDEERTAANLAELAGHPGLRDLLLDPTGVMELAEATGLSSERESDPRAPGGGVSATAGAVAAGGGAPLRTGPAGSEGSRGPLPGGVEPPSDRAGPATADVGRVGGESPSGRSALTAASSIPLPASAHRGGPRPPAPVATGIPAESPEGAGRIVSIRGLSLKAVSAGRPASPEGSLEGGTKSAGAPGAVAELRLQRYQEAPLPLILKSVDSSAGLARVRVLSRADATPVAVQRGELIPGTPYLLTGIESRQISSKLSDGKRVDVSRIRIEDTRTGATLSLVKDVPGRSADASALLALPGGDLEYLVRKGDRFRAAGGDGSPRDYEILEVRPTQVLIRDLSADEVMTVHRDGIAMR